MSVDRARDTEVARCRLDEHVDEVGISGKVMVYWYEILEGTEVSKVT